MQPVTNPYPQTRNLICVAVDLYALSYIFTESAPTVATYVGKGIPASASLVSASTQKSYGDFELLIFIFEDKSFAPVAEGAEIPLFSPVFYRIQDEHIATLKMG